MHTSGVGPVDGRAIDSLALLLCLVKPATGYRVYDVQHAQLVCSRRLLEVSKDLLDENRLGLDGRSATGQHSYARGRRVRLRWRPRQLNHTWTLLTQRLVSVLIWVPETPGGLRTSMAFKPASSSATGDDILPCVVFGCRVCLVRLLACFLALPRERCEQVGRQRDAWLGVRAYVNGRSLPIPIQGSAGNNNTAVARRA